MIYLLQDKILLYLWDVVTRDSIESQQRGFVIIRLLSTVSREDTFPPTESSTADGFRSVVNNFNRILSSIPSRLVAVHTRVPNHPGHKLVWKLFVTHVFSGENVSLRSRFVASLTSSSMEMIYRLKTYGIPIKTLPLTESNSIKSAYHNQWIKTRKLLEEQELKLQKTAHANILDPFAAASEDCKIIECPALNDVVFRQGSKVTSVENPGNRIFQDLLRTFLVEKERVTQEIKHADSKFAQRTSDTHPDRTSSNFYLSDTDSNPSIGGKKKTGKVFCDWLIDYIEQERKGRFLEWNSTVNGWVVMRDKIQISKKVSNTMYNWAKRIGKRPGYRPEPSLSEPIDDNATNGNDCQSNNKNAFNAYRFIDGRRPPFELEDTCYIPSTHPSSVQEATISPSIGKKRPRIDDGVPP